MTALTRSFRRRLQRRDRAAGAGDAAVEPPSPAADAPPEQESPVEIAPNDPLLAYFQSASEAVDIEALDLDSPALRELKAAGVKLAVPLVSQGELIGVLNLGPRLSEQDYSSDDRKLLDNLAAQAAPALRVGQLVREQEAEAATRQRFEQELEVARLIQQHFLPKELPDLPGWQIARVLPAGPRGRRRLLRRDPAAGRARRLRVGDVTDKGVPAALVMSATRSVLRASAQRLIEPGAVLERVNEHLCPDMPEKMFVTCLYGVLDTASGLSALRERGPRPSLRQDGRRRRRAACPRHAARSDAGDVIRGEGSRCLRPGTASCSIPTGCSRPTTPNARCSAPAAQGDRWPARPAAAS